MSEEQKPADNDAADIPASDPSSDVEALRAEAQALKEQVLRYAADAENTRRRAEREANDARVYAIQKFAKDLLGVADNLARALAAAPAEAADGPVKNFVVGVEMTEKELQSAFERNGLKKVDPAPGSRFDPHQHQAMMEQPSTEVAGGGVIQVLQPGYELFGRVLRPAMVVVAAKGSGGQAAAQPAGQNPYEAGEGDAPGESVDRRA